MKTGHRVLLFGSTGQLGERILERWHDTEIIAPTSQQVNVTEHDRVAATIAREQPNLVVNATAFNDVAGAETNVQAAFAINALAVGNMAEACAAAGCMLLTVSTDYVFDGLLGRPYRESDPARPVSAYGISKYCGELLASRYDGPIYIVRTSALYGTKVSASKGYSFIDRILQNARRGETLKIVDDQTVSPTYAGHLAAALSTFIEGGIEPGTYHIVNEGAVTWFEFAKEILKQAGVQTALERTVTAPGFRPKRPPYSALRNSRLSGQSMPDWRAGIAAYLQERTHTFPADA